MRAHRAVFAAMLHAGMAGTAAVAGAQPPQAAIAVAPAGEHHLHLLSPATALMAHEPPLPAVPVPAAISAVLLELERGWNDTTSIANVLAEDAAFYNSGNPDLPTWVLGRRSGARYLSERFARAYRITPIWHNVEEGSAQVAGYLSRGEGTATRHFGHVLIALSRKGGAWRITGMTPIFPGPPTSEPITAQKVIAQLDEGGFKRAAVLSLAYWYGSPNATATANEHALVRAENDWVARQVAEFPDRLAAFCSFNPLKDYALEELERCSRNPVFRGIKLHFGNSHVEITRSADADKVSRVFRAANRHGMAVILHMWTSPEYESTGGSDARAVLRHLLPEAPNVPVQIAHMAGGGRATDSALAVFADAIVANDPRTRNLYFDVATLTAGESSEGLERVAMRMRQIGLHRILFGSDMSPPNPSPRDSWQLFRSKVPLTDAEFNSIATNVAPYFR